MPTWDPARYLQFADDRARPFFDLLAQVPIAPKSIIDLGCGPGQLTRPMRSIWPEATILGVDSSEAMIDTAIRENSDPHANYDVADLRTWEPPTTADLMVSNAVFQWVPDQFDVIERLLGSLADGGVFAVQVPNNADAPSHLSLLELSRDARFAEHLENARRLPAVEPEAYLEFFAERGYSVNAWSTTYRHILAGPDPVFDWISGTGARPYLDALPDDLRGEDRKSVV